MKDYLIWLGEKLEKFMIGFSWEQIMKFCTETDVSHIPGYTVYDYLKEGTTNV